jgi:hypothetical protein
MELWRCHKDKKADVFANKLIFVTKMYRYLPLHLLLRLRPFLAIVMPLPQTCSPTHNVPPTTNNREMTHFVVVTRGGAAIYHCSSSKYEILIYAGRCILVKISK